jgi:putative transposase
MEQEEYEAMQKLALEQLRAGKSLTGKGGAFAPLLKQFLESALESEMESHLSEQESESGNKRNGKGRKTMKSLDGEIDIVNPKPRA